MIEGVAIAPAQEAPCKAVTRYDDALDRMLADVGPTDAETVAIEDAVGRRLAAPVEARIAAPRVDVAAMDGYAVRTGDLGGTPVYFQIVDQSFPGGAASRPMAGGEAVRIFTGAPMPAGADRVVMQEFGQPIGDGVILSGPIAGRRHVREAGCDFAADQMLLAAGHIMDVQAMMVAAAADCAVVFVWRKPRVAILASGDELVRPGEAAGTQRGVPDSISLPLLMLCQQSGGIVNAAIRVPDDAARLGVAADLLLKSADILIVTGGASVGDRDHCRRVLSDRGMKTIFASVAMKPAKPVWYGRMGGTHIVGLPGNPAAALMAARLFVVPLLRAMTGATTAGHYWENVRACGAMPTSGDRDIFLWARRSADGVEPLVEQQASMQHMLAQANAIIHLPRGCLGGAAIVRTMRF